ncbi:MAG TPA: LysR substrate-binding domain-containing protein [Dongiaceae bacterium]|jgi:LysR family glycine cleavage system transcriptional activator|nr:LysR substrate-binding domain-containing protein [Dongiaceae bacterium]
MRRLLPLAGLRAFEAAARHLSFKRAAEELHVTPTAISHHVRQLEEAIGARLFERRTRQVLLTPEGQVLLPVLRDGFDSFARTLDGLTRRQRRTTVTLSATPAFTAKWLVPRIAAFRKVRPDIDLTLLATLEVIDVKSGVADLALRYGRGPYPDLIAEPLTVERFAPVASPRLRLKKPGDLRSATLLHSDWRRSDPRNPTWRHWLKIAGIEGVDARAGLRFSDETHAIQAAVAGTGIALHSLLLVQEELATGTLVVPFGPEIEGFALHLVRGRDRPLTEPIEAVQGWLRAQFAEAPTSADARRP